MLSSLCHLRGQIEARNVSVAGRRQDLSRKDFESGGFSSAVDAEESETLAVFDCEGDSVHSHFELL